MSWRQPTGCFHLHIHQGTKILFGLYYNWQMASDTLKITCVAFITFQLFVCGKLVVGTSKFWRSILAQYLKNIKLPYFIYNLGQSYYTDSIKQMYSCNIPHITYFYLRTPITSRLLSPARAASPSVRRRHASEMSNPEFALFMEKEHLRGAEEDDYIIMENLIQRR